MMFSQNQNKKVFGVLLKLNNVEIIKMLADNCATKNGPER